MKPKINNRQLLGLRKLLNNFEEFNKSGYGNISNIEILNYVPQKDSIIVKYEKSYMNAGEMAYDFRIARIKEDGEVEFLDEKFKDMFERSAFLSECVSFDIEDPMSYEKID